MFAVFAGAGDIPPLLGNYTVESGSLVFRPRFPFAPGVTYRAVFHPPGGRPPIEKSFEGPSRETKSVARVERIYPSASVLPSNQLRLYIYFSAPMSRGEAGRRIRMLDQNGRVLRAVFLPGEELWDPQYRRLTMTFDPGRIKRGLTSNEALGPPIVEGKRYTLVIDHGWPDARGVPMLEGFRKSFRGGPAVRIPPDPKQWKLAAPKPGSKDALTLSFPEPMNYPLLLRMLQVSRGKNKVVGKVTIGKQETEWSFAPAEPWEPGEYQLIVDTGLEDLAGNHIGQAFDIDVFDRVTKHISSSAITLPFAVR
ncbi:MAG TPA: Ig-like domain-containing protein [Bryobacteraceae bacterium]|nr:Ig-like domain-containing protein [Bryobacteraceae bacterium]